MNNRRFSISTLLLTTALIACSVSHFLASRELARTKSALTSLRNESLILDADDDSLIHAISLPSNGQLQWRWKVQLPRHGTFRLRYAFDNIPLSDFPANSTAMNAAFLGSDGSPIPGGTDIELEIAVFKDSDRGWQIQSNNGDRGTAHPIKDPPSWLDSYTATGWSSWIAGTRQTFSASSDSGMTLISRRKARVVANSSTVETNPTDGLSVWIERIE